MIVLNYLKSLEKFVLRCCGAVKAAWHCFNAPRPDCLQKLNLMHICAWKTKTFLDKSQFFRKPPKFLSQNCQTTPHSLGFTRTLISQKKLLFSFSFQLIRKTDFRSGRSIESELIAEIVNEFSEGWQ